jgi:hypothetical protein
MVAVAIVAILVTLWLRHAVREERKANAQGGGWRVAFVLEKFGEYRELYSTEAAELDGLKGKISKSELEFRRGLLKDKYQRITPPEVEAALRAAVGAKYDKRTPTGSSRPGATNQQINQAGMVSKYVGRVLVVVMLYSEYEKIRAADDWERQLGSSGSGVLGSVAGGFVGGAVVGGELGAAGANPYTVAGGALVGGIAGGIVGYNLFSGAYEELWDISYADE